MALTPCPDCGNQISTEAWACPTCGRPNKRQGRRFMMTWVIMMVALSAIGVLTAMRSR